jgi:hypothetical protein
MPFGKGGTFKAYEDGDFIFGLAEAVSSFKKVNDKTKGSLSQPVNTVKQLTNVIDDLSKFSDDRFDQNYAYLDSLLNHPKYHTAVVSRKLSLSTSDKPGGEGSNEAFRRKSKGALNYLISQGKSLHFILDGLDMAGVAGKVNFPTKQDKSPQPTSDGPPKYSDVTGAELRWIYRHRDDPNTQRAVQFWMKSLQCDAPWDQIKFKDVWSKYKPKNEI